jgi:hypothetical protein
VPTFPLNESTNLTVLNARLGSRFSSSLVFSENALHTGALGMDFDELKELLVAVKVNGKTACFYTSAPTRNGTYLQQQSLQVGMTATKLKGVHPDGIEITATLVSPFTISESLQDTNRLKIQIAPVYYWLIEVKNTTNNTQEVEVQLGLKAIPYDRNSFSGLTTWRRNRKYQEMFYKSGDENTVLALSSTDTAVGHFQNGGFNGLTKKIKLEAGNNIITPFVYATHYAGKVMQDEKFNQVLRFHYLKYWRNIDQVLQYAHATMPENLKYSANFETILTRSKATPEEKWVTAIAFRSDIANSMLLDDEKGKTRFFLTEGRFRHMNTLDVAHETELAAIFAPWRLKLQLDTWTDYLAIKPEKVKSIRYANGSFIETQEGYSAAEYGPFLHHDVGDAPFVMNAEAYNFGPFMAIEENSNFTLLLYWYWKISGDSAFVRQYLGLVDALLYSMINRDTDNSGLADEAVGWSTYDVSDAIKRSSENTLLGVKQMTAYLAAAEMFEQLADSRPSSELTHGEGTDGDHRIKFGTMHFNNVKLRKKQALTYRAEAAKIVATLKKSFKKYGYLPVSLQQKLEGWDQLSVVLSEGLLYAGLCNLQSPILKEAIPMLKTTYEKAFAASQTPYGVKLSAKEDVTWFSKVMVADIVASYNFNIKNSTAIFAFKWNKNNSQAYQDGAYSETREWVGNWYPRGIIAFGYLFREANFTATQREQFVKDLR